MFSSMWSCRECTIWKVFDQLWCGSVCMHTHTRTHTHARTRAQRHNHTKCGYFAITPIILLWLLNPIAAQTLPTTAKLSVLLLSSSKTEWRMMCRCICLPQVEVILCVVQPQTNSHRVPFPTLCEDVIHGYTVGWLPWVFALSIPFKIRNM